MTLLDLFCVPKVVLIAASAQQCYTNRDIMAVNPIERIYGLVCRIAPLIRLSTYSVDTGSNYLHLIFSLVHLAPDQSKVETEYLIAHNGWYDRDEVSCTSFPSLNCRGLRRGGHQYGSQITSNYRRPL